MDSSTLPFFPVASSSSWVLPLHNFRPEQGAGPEDEDDEAEMSSADERKTGRPAQKTRRKPIKRNRTITKCDRCRQRKQRCNSVLPCDTCRAYHVDCHYSIGKPLETREEPETASPQEVNDLRDSLARVESILQAHLEAAAASSDRLRDPMGSSPDGLRPQSLPVDLEADNVAAHIAQLWHREDVSDHVVTTRHPLVGQLHEAVKEASPPGRIAASSSSPPTSRSIGPVSANIKSPFPSGLRNLSDDSLLGLLPTEIQAVWLLDVFFTSGNWFFELCDREATRDLVSRLYAFLHTRCSVTLAEDGADRDELWTSVATVLALCRVAVNFVGPDDAAKWHLDFKGSGGRPAFVKGWGEIAAVALDKAHSVTRPSLDTFKALVLLLSNVYFQDEDLGATEPYNSWRAQAVQMAYPLQLNREPPAKVDAVEADQRRRLFWSLVCIDCHLAVANSSPQSMIQLEMADVGIPRSPAYSPYPGLTPTLNDACLLDLRSSEVRFLMGAFNNRVSRLTARREPPPTSEDVVKLDEELVKWADRVLPDQRMHIHQDNIYTTGLGTPRDVVVGQQVFYVSVFYIRLRLNRPLHTPGASNIQASNTGRHRDAVLKSSLLLLRLHELGTLTTAFVSAVANAALSILLDVYVRPDSGDAAYLLETLRPFLGSLRRFPGVLLRRATAILDRLWSLAEASKEKARVEAADRAAAAALTGTSDLALQTLESPWFQDGLGFTDVQQLSFTAATSPGPSSTFATAALPSTPFAAVGTVAATASMTASYDPHTPSTGTPLDFAALEQPFGGSSAFPRYDSLTDPVTGTGWGFGAFGSV